MFQSITQEMMGLLKFLCHFELSQIIFLKVIKLFFNIVGPIDRIKFEN